MTAEGRQSTKLFLDKSLAARQWFECSIRIARHPLRLDHGVTIQRPVYMGIQQTITAGFIPDLGRDLILVDGQREQHARIVPIVTIGDDRELLFTARAMNETFTL